MAIDYHRLKARAFPDVRQRVRIHDTMLYALSLGVGNDPLDERALPYVYEGMAGGLRALPTMTAVLGYPGFWLRDPESGVDWVQVLHGEQSLRMHAPLPPEGDVVGRNRVTHLVDKGEGRGALIVAERELRSGDGTLIATLTHSAFCRGDGGFSRLRGGQPSDAPPPAPAQVPLDREPDVVDDLPTRPETALLYRLHADDNPLHAEPAVARAAGFDRPILHGLATYGLAAWSLIRSCAGYDASRLKAIAVRFAAPVFPGETLRTEIWRAGGDKLQFRARVLERDKVVLSHGSAEVSA